jgi:hypothetical protein
MILRRFVCLSLGLASLVFSNAAHAEDLFVAAGADFPGKLWYSEGGALLRPIHARLGRPDPAYPRAVMKLAQVAVAPDNKVFFCSGLDGYVMHLLDGRHEIQSFEFDGQIRDLACTGEEATVYFSVVPTPRNNEPLADGKIYRRNFGDGQPTVVATIRQSDVGGNWWGTFTIRDGSIFISTMEENSRILEVAGDAVTPLFTAPGMRIQGLSTDREGAFYFVTGAGKVYRTIDFSAIEPALVTPRRLTDVTLRAVAGSPRP